MERQNAILRVQKKFQNLQSGIFCVTGACEQASFFVGIS